MNIKDYGFPSSIEYDNKAGIPARISSHSHSLYSVVCDRGEGFARLKGSAYREGAAEAPTVGDYVLLDWRDDGESRILETLPRRSYFSRLDPSSSGRGEQAVAANFDYVFILQSLNRDFNLRRLERYLTLGWQSGATPVVILTKCDSVPDYGPELRAASDCAIGAEVFALSAKTGEGLEQLAKFEQPGKTIVFLGSSGVGKSSLINAMAGEDLAQTGGIREKDGRGRHTTTTRQLIRLPSGLIVIDTPGMRELGMWDVSEGLEKSFADVEAYFGQCKFSDCRHESEPGCAVKAAIKRGEISQEHWEAYRKLAREAKFVGDKAARAREEKKKGKEMAGILKDYYLHPRGTGGADYRSVPCTESFECKVCKRPVSPENAGSGHRNHCPNCLSSVHVDNKPGDRASSCREVMEPIGVWVRKNGEWAIIHRCRGCGKLSSNRIAADDNQTLLMSIAAKPLAEPPFPLWQTGNE